MAACRTTVPGWAIHPIRAASRNSRWENMFGGDGFWMFEDPSDPDYIYAEAQGGEIGRVNRYTHEIRELHPWPNYGEKKLRFNWNTPIHMSPNEKGNDLHRRAVPVPLARSRPVLGSHLARPDDQRSGEAEAGRIRRRDRRQLIGGDAHDDLFDFGIAEERADHLGRHRRRERADHPRWRQDLDECGRETSAGWERIPGSRPSKPAASMKATAYATFDRHTFGDMKPYVYKTTDYGKTWTALPAQESGVRGLCPRDQGRHGRSECAFPGHGIRALDFGGWRTALGAIQRKRISRRSPVR